MKPAKLTERLKRVLTGLVRAVGDEDCRYGQTSDHDLFLGSPSSLSIDTPHYIIAATELDDGSSQPFKALYAQHQDN